LLVIVRLRASSADTDRYGDPVATGEPERTPLLGAFVAPRESNDINDRGRQGVIVGLTLFAHFGTDIVHTDQIEVDGVIYNVDGEPGQWKNPLTEWEAGCQVALVRAAG
jgi:hypothetical protein